MIQSLVEQEQEITPHQLEYYLPPKKPLGHAPAKDSLTNLEVYVDDFIAITNDLSEKNLEKWSRAILHSIHAVFPPPSVTGHTGGDPISIKMLKQEEGRWNFEKEILGNGKNYTLQLLLTKSKILSQLLKAMAKKATATLNDFQKVAGKLVHASVGIPKGAGLLSPVYKGFQTSAEFVTITKEICQCFTDWRFILQLMETRPTSVLELTAEEPWFIGYTDACNTGVGGVWTDGKKSFTSPIVWRLQ